MSRPHETTPMTDDDRAALELAKQLGIEMTPIRVEKTRYYFSLGERGNGEPYPTIPKP